MAYLTPAELSTHMYDEVVAEIIREDPTIAQRAIDTAIAEAQGYLSRYELTQLMGDPATPLDENLKSKVKDLACWQLVKLSNPNIDLKLIRTAYEDAIKWFDKIMRGLMSPAGWPYHDTTVDPAPPQGNEIYYSSNRKREQHY
jgi:phage gp36-like protein